MVDSGRDGKSIFEVLKSADDDHGPSARLGRLSLPGRKPIDTPNFISLTSRGAVPHMTPDNVANRTELCGTYMALEDFLETSKKRPFPAIYNMDSRATGAGAGGSPPPPSLHAYTATPRDLVTVLGARRHPAVPSPLGNGRAFVSVFTSTGFRRLRADEYRRAVDVVRPDIAVPLADLTFAPPSQQPPPARKRQERMVARTEDWLAAFFVRPPKSNGDGDGGQDGRGDDGGDGARRWCGAHVFAPLLPVPYPMQRDYVERLEEDYYAQQHLLSGLAVYDADVLPDLGRHHAALAPLPRLSLDVSVASPHDILRQIRLGVDLFTLPFLNAASDAGIALHFTFPPVPAPAQAQARLTDSAGPRLRPLGVDLWSAAEDHQTSLAPLREGCGCYACANHHRAYLHHLLGTQEMLAWTLLQMHNLRVMADFFAGVRAVLQQQSSSSSDPAATAATRVAFDEACDAFARVYEPELPRATGTRPRARGYHFKSQAGAARRNPPAWERYEEDGDDGPNGNGSDGAAAADDPVLAGERAGLAVTGAAVADVSEIPLVPDGDAGQLDRMGFAEMKK
ncbi:tRNA-guanine transglycosylase family protein [Xylariaceae sp. FL0804]|nr:tRNA-guanine transglycosylase family protein [Xylariaceae sp. FL0804]